jgi:putative hydrolase of the HAD superfamily
LARAIVFDVDGVLVHGYHARPDLRDRWDAALQNIGINPDRFQREFIFDIFMKRVLIGEMPMVEALDRRLKAFGYRGSTMAMLDLWLGFDFNPNTELVEIVRRLKAHEDVRLYLATNQDHSRAQFIWHNAQLSGLFDDMFYSARFGRTKYDKKFFAMADERMITSDEPPLFFDDTEKVLDVARKAGWETSHFTGNDVVTAHPWIAERLKS